MAVQHLTFQDAAPIATVELGVTDMRYARVLTKALAITFHVHPVVNSRLLAITRSKLW